MNVPFVNFQYCNLKVFSVLYLQANGGFLHLVHLNEIFQNKLIRFLDPPDPLPPVALNLLWE